MAIERRKRAISDSEASETSSNVSDSEHFTEPGSATASADSAYESDDSDAVDAVPRPAQTRRPPTKRARPAKAARAARGTLSLPEAIPSPPSMASSPPSSPPSPPRHVGPRTSKQATLHMDGTVNDGIEQLDDVDLARIDAVQTNARELVRDSSGFVTGSIVRVELHNFVIYDHVAFNTGPRMNMIIGPNGTGKSTIACAIALGLAFPTSVLGRATKISEFIKLGTESCSIELELKGQPGGANTVIRREIMRTSGDNASSTFSINGRPVSAKDVELKIEQLQIQANNLCAFLPQDRVVEFSKMKPDELLRETQRAYGDRRLSEWHAYLIGKYKVEKELSETVARYERSMEEMNARQAETEEQVRVFEQRKELQEKLAVLDILKPMAMYNEAKGAFKEEKAELDKVKSEQAALEASQEPLFARIEHIEQDLQNMEAQKRRETENDRDLKNKMNQKTAQIDQIEIQISSMDDKLRESQREVAKREESIRTITEKIAQLTAVHGPRPTVDLAPYKKAIQDLQAQRRDIISQQKRAEQEARARKDEAESLEESVSSLHKRLDREENLSRQRESSLRDNDEDTYLALKWLRDTGAHHMRAPFCEPPRLTVQAKSMAVAGLVEPLISYAAFRTFIFSDSRDFDYFTKEMNDKRGLRVNAHQLGAASETGGQWGGNVNDATPASWDDALAGASNAPAVSNASDLVPPRTRSRAKALGFDAFAIDLIEAPPLAIRFLCETAKLEQIPVATGPNADTSALEDSGICTRYVTPAGVCVLRRSRYGRREKQVQVNPLQPSRILSQGVDAALVARLQRQIQEASASAAAAADAAFGARARASELRSEAADADTAVRDAQAQFTAAERPLTQWDSDEKYLRYHQTKLERERAEQNRRDPAAEIAAEIAVHTRSRAGVACALQALQRQRLASLDATHIRELRVLQCAANKRELDNECDQARERMRAVRARMSELRTTVDAARATMETAHAAATAAVTDATPAARAAATARGAVAYDDVIREQTDATAQLHSTLEVSAAVYETFERRRAEMVAVGVKLADARAQHEVLGVKMASVRQKWEGMLEGVVRSVSEGFSRAFGDLGLCGEVRLRKHEDYAQWGIDILVSFRDNEEMHELDPHRQSGGERALTTTMYLKSLSEISRTPFTLVDEINQGMDRRVERQVHNALVAAADHPNVGQYFLITPKLLGDLNYAPSMKVLVIHNGQYLPEKLDLDHFLSLKERA